MQVHLDPRFEAMIRKKVESGEYADASDVVTDALRLMESHDRRGQELRADVAEGFAQVERGESVELTPERMDQIMERARENARRGKPVKDAVRP
jgi:putative addiction module CopG family antidote